MATDYRLFPAGQAYSSSVSHQVFALECFYRRQTQNMLTKP